MPRDFKIKPLSQLFISIIFLSACAKPLDKDVAAYVNNEPIYGSELKREIARKAQCDPSFKLTLQAQCDYLDSLINRKLIVQAAVRKGMTQEERFMNTIKNFWEQTLVRDFIDYKNKQAADYIFVTEEEVNKYYDNLSKKVTFKILRVKDKQRLTEAYQKYLKDKDTTGWQVMGPLGYDEIDSLALLDCFNTAPAQAQAIEDFGNYYLVVVAAKEPVSVKPLAEIKPDIQKWITMLKEKRLFEEWLKEERKKAKIEINKDYLK